MMSPVNIKPMEDLERERSREDKGLLFQVSSFYMQIHYHTLEKYAKLYALLLGLQLSTEKKVVPKLHS